MSYLVVLLAQNSKLLGESDIESLRIRSSFLKESDPLRTAIMPAENTWNIN